MSDENVAPKEEVEAQVVNMTEAGADTVKAEMVRMQQSGANSIFADEMGMTQSGAVGVKAQTLSAHESGVVALQADEVNLAQSGVVVLNADDVYLQGRVGVVVANNVEVKESAVLTVASQNLRAERIETKILLAGSVEGEVHTVVDTREAVLIGLIGGVVSGIFLLLGRFLFGRKK